MGTLAIVAETESPAPAPETPNNPVDTMTVVVPSKDGGLSLDLTREGLQAVVNVLTDKPADAEAIIKEMEDGDALILIHIVDSRKSVKAAAEERAKALNPEESEGNPEESEGEQ